MHTRTIANVCAILMLRVETSAKKAAGGSSFPFDNPTFEVSHFPFIDQAKQNEKNARLKSFSTASSRSRTKLFPPRTKSLVLGSHLRNPARTAPAQLVASPDITKSSTGGFHSFRVTPAPHIYHKNDIQDTMENDPDVPEALSTADALRLEMPGSMKDDSSKSSHAENNKDIVDSLNAAKMQVDSLKLTAEKVRTREVLHRLVLPSEPKI